MVTADIPRDVQYNVDFFRDGPSDEKWRNRDDGTSFAVGLISPAVDLRDALQKFTQTWESEYGRQYVRAVVSVISTCRACYGTGKIRSKRSAYKFITCKACRGLESTRPLVTDVDYRRSCPHSAEQNMGGECEACYLKRTA